MKITNSIVSNHLVKAFGYRKCGDCECDFINQYNGGIVEVHLNNYSCYCINLSTLNYKDNLNIDYKDEDFFKKLNKYITDSKCYDKVKYRKYKISKI